MQVALQERYRKGKAPGSAAVKRSIPRISVREVALSDSVGSQTLGIPLHSMAESTAHDCAKQYDAYHGCNFVTVETDTIDRQIDAYRASPRPVCHGSQGCALDHDAAVLDVVKVHVQGHELRVLRGARRSLLTGTICSLLLRVNYREAFALQGGTVNEVESLALEIHELLREYAVRLVDSNGKPEALDSHGRVLSAWLKQISGIGSNTTAVAPARSFNELVAWHEGSQCHKSLAVASMKKLFSGERRTPLDTLERTAAAAAW